MYIYFVYKFQETLLGETLRKRHKATIARKKTLKKINNMIKVNSVLTH